jgi:hypothetical protein
VRVSHWKAAAGSCLAALALVLAVAAPAGASPGVEAAHLAPSVQAAANTPAPTVSPGVTRTYVAAGSTQTCANGYLCAYVPYGNGYYRFNFTHCRLYYVSNWHGTGLFTNAQYGGVTARFYKQSGATYAKTNKRGSFSISWEPVWSLKPC